MSRHDLGGSLTRLAKVVQDLSIHTAETAPQWQDQQARRFFQQHVEPIEPTVARLIAGLNESIDVARDIEKKLSDPRY